MYVPIQLRCHTGHVRWPGMTSDNTMTQRAAVVEAIRSSWCVDTIAEGDWNADNPSRGQCEPSSFVAWRFLGGDLVLGRVLVDGEQVEHHY